MSHSIYESYLQSEVLTADPVKLVSILYRGAIDAIGAARRHLQAGEIRERARQINKTMDILTELTNSLNHERGGDLSRSLQALYAYMQNRLLEANGRQAEPPLIEVQALLTTLNEAWRAIRPPATLSEKVAEHEEYVRRAFGQTPHEVGIPFSAVGDIQA
jgi:flagellar secretion chaperone FliS